METSASFEARSAPLPYPTANERTYGSVRGVLGNQYPYRDRQPPCNCQSGIALEKSG
jgi:hypothetical protein